VCEGEVDTRDEIFRRILNDVRHVNNTAVLQVYTFPSESNWTVHTCRRPSVWIDNLSCVKYKMKLFNLFPNKNDSLNETPSQMELYFKCS
jgi:hypothetical protein